MEEEKYILTWEKEIKEDALRKSFFFFLLKDRKTGKNMLKGTDKYFYLKKTEIKENIEE